MILTDYFKPIPIANAVGIFILMRQICRKKKKQQTQQNQSTRQLLGIEGITEYSLKTASNEAAFFSIKPSNISVMSEASLSAKIYSLMSVLKGLTEIEILCVNSRESFEGNKNHLKALSQKEENPAVRKLLEQDMKHLDQIQALTATAREFLLIVRIRGMKDKEIFSTSTVLKRP